ncbi:hypothetical protein, partial [Flavonifractor plautii]|uniref:hypothetical protein n=1 Tax=Flavonifractor plautii TaxID=292800 RepID=UPI003D7D20F6
MKSRRGQWINWAGLRCTARVLLQPELARPRLCVESVASLDWRALRDAHGLSGVVLDKDNTVTLPYAGALHPRVEAAVRDAQAVFGADRVV